MRAASHPPKLLLCGRLLPRQLGACALMANWLSVAACTTDHSNLVRQRDAPEPPERPGFSVVGDAGPFEAGLVPAATEEEGPVEDPRAGLEPEPVGRTALTLVHGLADAPTLAFCLVTSDGDGLPAFSGPLPSRGLSLGESVVISPSEDHPFGETQADVFVVAASGELIAASSCGSLLVQAGLLEGDAGTPIPVELDGGSSGRPELDAAYPERDAGSTETTPDASTRLDAAAAEETDAGRDAGQSPTVVFPRLRVAALAQLPAAALAEELSYLLVATGCLGSTDFRSNLESQVCGGSYAAHGTSLAPVFLSLSRRTRADSVALQVVNAAAALSSLTLRTVAQEGEDTRRLTVATDVVFGEVAPRQTRVGISSSELGEPLDEMTFELLSGQVSDPLAVVRWAEPLGRLGVGSLAQGRAYTLVLVGPRPGLRSGPWWGDSAVGLIRSDPLAD